MPELSKFHVRCIMRKPVYGVSDQVHHKPGYTITEEMARGLKFYIKEVEIFFYLFYRKKLISSTFSVFIFHKTNDNFIFNDKYILGD